MAREHRGKMQKQDPRQNWTPKTELGMKVLNGEITNIMQVFEQGHVIREAEIVDVLVPDLEEEVMFLGGVPGKGGGKKRIPLRTTTRMHQSGRKRSLHAMIVVGNKNGLVGIGYEYGLDAKSAMQKAAKKAKLNLTYVRRGCGSWQCGCSTPHSIPLKTESKAGSVAVKLMPAPKGAELKVASEIKKIMRLAGIKDIWAKTRGQTDTRLNFAKANFAALVNLNRVKLSDEQKKRLGIVEGPAYAQKQTEEKA